MKIKVTVQIDDIGKISEAYEYSKILVKNIYRMAPRDKEDVLHIIRTIYTEIKELIESLDEETKEANKELLKEIVASKDRINRTMRMYPPLWEVTKTNRFDQLTKLKDISIFANCVFELTRGCNTSMDFEKVLATEFTEEELQFQRAVATKNKDYPLSLEQLQ